MGVMVLVTIIAVNSPVDKDPPLPEKAQNLLSSGAPFLPVQFIVKASYLPDSSDFEAIEAWNDGFERDLVTALNDEDGGLPSLRNDEQGLNVYTTDLVLHERQVAVG